MVLPPTTYTEWMSLLESVGNIPPSHEVLRALSEGNLAEGRQIEGQLFNRVVEFEDAALTSLVRGFERKVAMLPIDSASDDVAALVERFSRECESLMFYSGLACMSAERIAELDSALTAQVARVFRDLVHHLERQSTAGPSGDLVLRASRLRDKWARGVRVGQLR